MSLTNPNTPVSQQDLQDFYHKLLPYMGGSFGMIANKFSKGDMYSTDEKMIGQWIDGKPLYQRSVSSNFPNSAGSAVSVVDFTSWNVEAVVNVKIYGQLFGASNFQNETFIGSGSFTMFTRRQPAYPSDTLNINLSNVDYKNQPIVITFQYTKTTDSAISIGDDTDYSTEEKIVGTWIDGSPVYQKTVNSITLPSDNTYENIQDVSSLNIETIISINGNCKLNNTLIPIPFYTGNGNWIGAWITSEQQLRLGQKGFANYSASITIQYTKTT